MKIRIKDKNIRARWVSPKLSCLLKITIEVTMRILKLFFFFSIFAIFKTPENRESNHFL